MHFFGQARVGRAGSPMCSEIDASVSFSEKNRRTRLRGAVSSGETPNGRSREPELV